MSRQQNHHQPAKMEILSPPIIPGLSQQSSSSTPSGSTNNVPTPTPSVVIDSYEDMFKEITKKLYGESNQEIQQQQSIIFDELLPQQQAQQFQVPPPPQQQQQPPAPAQPVPQLLEERWFESNQTLDWTTSKIARYNPLQKVFRCIDCDFVGFLSRVAEHWLGNHASLRVFQCPRCPYTSAWARCVRMHLTRQHNELVEQSSYNWKENPVLEEVTKYLTSLKSRVEQKSQEINSTGEKRYTCPFCTYATDRRDLFNRHENIHRDEKPFVCYVCTKQFNRADHVKKHFTRMHREETYDIAKIRKNLRRYTTTDGGGSDGIKFYSQSTKFIAPPSTGGGKKVEHQINSFNPSVPEGFTGMLRGVEGVGGGKREGKKFKKSKPTTTSSKPERLYTCSYCPWQGVDNWCLKRHLNTHIKPFLCTLCDYKAARSERLATHVLKVHNKRVCAKCEFLADDLELLGVHVQERHQNPLIKSGYNCNVCQEYFELRADLEAHAILEHHKVIVQCDLCDFRTTDELAMEGHLRDKHNLQPGMGAVAAAAAAAAQAAAMGVGQQQQQQQQQQQKKVQPSQQPPPTNLPPQIPTTNLPPPPIIPHLNKPISPPPPPPLIIKPDQQQDETLCTNCGCQFTDNYNLLQHSSQHEFYGNELITPRTSKAISRLYTCSTCSYNTSTVSLMMQHQRLHTGMELRCRACNHDDDGPAFVFDYNLKEHIKAEHGNGNNNNIRCPHCGLLQHSITNFNRHWLTHHGNICSLCVNIYKSKYGVKECELSEILDNSDDTAAVAMENDSDLESCLTLIKSYFKRESISFLPKLSELEVRVLSNPFSSEYEDDYISPWQRRYPQYNKQVLRRKNYSIINRKLCLSRFRLPLFNSSVYKCHRSHKCKSLYYNSKANYYLHKYWNHSNISSNFVNKCTNCSKGFEKFYQLYLHCNISKRGYCYGSVNNGV